MRISWIVVCTLALGACKSSSPPEEAASETEPEQAVVAEQAEPAEPAPGEPPAAEQPDTAASAQAASPVATPDPEAPADVAAPPGDAKRTRSGLASMVLKKGKGKGRPDRLDTVTIEYTGWTTDGAVFDSSARHGQPIEVRLTHVIPGLAEGIQLMAPGEKRRLWIPGKLAYGEEGSGEAPSPAQPLGMLVFDVELLGFEEAPKVPEAPKDVAKIPADAERSDSGLAWRVLEEGVGTEHPIDTSVVEIKYTMWTADGEVVDSSVLRGGPDTVGISRLIPGWTEAMKLMVEGERRLFWIPEDLAFQGAPHRPAGLVVVDVTLVQIRRDMHQVR